MASSAERGLDLGGVTAVVTGASRGIGRAVATRLAAAGSKVALVARTVTELEAAAASVGGEPFPADVSDEASVERLFAAVSAAFGGVPEIVVNAAGAFGLAPIAETEVAAFDRQLASNLRAPFLVMRAVLPAMLARGSGHILTIGSVAGRQGFAGNGAYSASKFGVVGLHAVLDAETVGTGVRATLVEPAATATTLWDEVDRTRYPDLPSTGAMMTVEAVADVVVYALTRPREIAVRRLFLERA